MQWPSRNVQMGGILHPAKANYSPETHQFLRVLMDESKLTMMQRKKFDYCLRNGEPLPLPTNRSCDSITPRKKPPKVLIRPGTSKRRSLDTIHKSGAYEREKFVPRGPKIDREKEKNRLQNKMAFGKEVEPKPSRKTKKPPETEETFNRFDQLVHEIKEREEWLKQMEELGVGKKHKLVIQQQIQARVREMEKLKIGDCNTLQ
ncbi:UPF0193 protein EVG1 homolog [Tribolium castaneum]|uniref:UPF0193 protein EVG1 homolog-like Protein n=1 Tax=Tribolium castaneum TaxID=7070 RepID=D6WYC8_TRICA|nr:PREDICTED: UPF0193 protein EVG1 homolog [Tribolium castaneum]EFA09132.2 UPF0193 protein EVG1 homolog-like Protein [Tribolium castaneum]|eukprot:XP_968243.2 PREDICTED: UPF0193 protein EVG1 homolog [Tribolium castaneum]